MMFVYGPSFEGAYHFFGILCFLSALACLGCAWFLRRGYRRLAWACEAVGSLYVVLLFVVPVVVTALAINPPPLTHIVRQNMNAQSAIPFLQPITWELLKQIQFLLGRWVMFLVVSLTLAAAGYYAWCKGTGRAFHFEELPRRQPGFVAGMSVAVPMLVAFFQSVWMCDSPYFEENAMVWRLSDPGLYVFLGIEALITFLLFRSFMKIRPWFRWPVLLLCLGLWALLAFSVGRTRGYYA